MQANNNPITGMNNATGICPLEVQVMTSSRFNTEMNTTTTRLSRVKADEGGAALTCLGSILLIFLITRYTSSEQAARIRVGIHNSDLPAILLGFMLRSKWMGTIAGTLFH